MTHHGKPYALIQTITEKDLEELGWKRLAETRLEEAWVGEDDALYGYLGSGPGSGGQRAVVYRWDSQFSHG